MAQPPSRRSSSGEIAQFLNRSKQVATSAAAGARLIFAVDATASRQPTWDQASKLQGEMFLSTSNLGGLAVQLCYYRGFNELRASQWLQDEAALLRQMSAVRCEGGLTQIQRLLNHALREHRALPVKAMVFIGDAIEESVDALCGKAGEAGLAGLPLFMFQEGRERKVEQGFRTMARLSGGAYARFDHHSAAQLAALLGAVARYAAGGRSSLLEYEQNSDSEVKLLLDQLK
ncbi:VWA domain-containing protein [Halieaceae bacterium IMCC14734]|uniref:VWA domain-containing protein n=1 Tax=Candidatus Litorirhabdus singularis TaxID=2518993 RepID=A0ABT3TIZ7_9GAMM|nr:VWA domain-containing protein [Candidatus Litorirhabdus singularis]MCX2981979.1 VWA domain-containing protein [Candidatus Litorirhabdus singularis]